MLRMMLAPSPSCTTHTKRWHTRPLKWHHQTPPHQHPVEAPLPPHECPDAAGGLASKAAGACCQVLCTDRGMWSCGTTAPLLHSLCRHRCTRCVAARLAPTHRHQCATPPLLSLAVAGAAVREHAGHRRGRHHRCRPVPDRRGAAADRVRRPAAPGARRAGAPHWHSVCSRRRVARNAARRRWPGCC
jgi:hypothetical protein